MPFKKSIRLTSFDYSSDGAYFVTICTFQKSKFIIPAYEIILKRELRELEIRFRGVKIDFFVFMPTHCHIIFVFRNAEVDLPKVIQAFKSITTLKLKKAGFHGSYFWQKNYYEHVVRDEEALYRIREYIKLNPESERLLNFSQSKHD
ncbi:hypothetical protein C4546_01465 [Candidatus Parcubacteria bacterium]|jgi:REP element-mobilizing transposase RayT|nr:MAG: hypothetical protein C4546_01465 [Candidatus Parcubacteria bacterium]